MGKTLKTAAAIAATIAAAITTTLSVIAAAVTATLNFKPLYYIDIYLLDIDEKSGMSYELLRENYSRLIDYNSMFNNDPLDFKDIPMSYTGRVHFQEVKDIFVLFQEMGLVCLIVSLLLSGILILKLRSKFFLKAAAVAGVALPAALGVLIGVNWDKAFVLFHEIAFDNDYWLFDSRTDPIIDALPDTFFLHCAVMILVLIALMCAGLLAAYRKVNVGDSPDSGDELTSVNYMI